VELTHHTKCCSWDADQHSITIRTLEEPKQDRRQNAIVVRCDRRQMSHHTGALLTVSCPYHGIDKLIEAPNGCPSDVDTGPRLTLSYSGDVHSRGWRVPIF